VSGDFDKKILSDLLWAAAKKNKERASSCTDNVEQMMFYRGKWLGFTEVALWLDGSYDFVGQQLELNLPQVPCPNCLGLSSAAIDPRFGECSGGCKRRS
jgi:hypothetical protein